MKKGKRIIALAGVILLAAVYLLTLIMAIMDSADTMIMFKACILTTILVPVLLWVYALFFRLFSDKSDEIRFDPGDTDDSDDSGDAENSDEPGDA